MRRLGFLRDQSGAAAAELVLWIALLIVPVLSVLDLGLYGFQRMQVEYAAQAGIQAARLACGDSAAPFTKNCAGLSSAVTAAVQSTLLGSSVSVSGAPVEGYYCVNSSGTLTAVGSVGSPPTKPSPFTCNSVVTGSTSAPGTYLQVSVTYDYTPIFTTSIGSLLTSPIVRTAWLRIE
jgi:Flp pilus assembly protein TadG